MRYGIRICEDNLPLITVLNGGIEPPILAKERFFVFEVTGPNTIENIKIVDEDVLYNPDGHLKDPITFVLS